MTQQQTNDTKKFVRNFAGEWISNGDMDLHLHSLNPLKDNEEDSLVYAANEVLQKSGINARIEEHGYDEFLIVYRPTIIDRILNMLGM